MNRVVLFQVLLFAIGTMNAVVRIQRIENHTPIGVYRIDLSGERKLTIPPSAAIEVDDLLCITSRNNFGIACLQGGYDPIYLDFKENVFTCMRENKEVGDSYMITMWMGPQTVFEDQKTYIPVCCGEDGAFNLIIHTDGLPELKPLFQASFLAETKIEVA